MPIRPDRAPELQARSAETPAAPAGSARELIILAHLPLARRLALRFRRIALTTSFRSPQWA
jgi:hypothetical protein